MCYPLSGKSGTAPSCHIFMRRDCVVPFDLAAAPHLCSYPSYKQIKPFFCPLFSITSSHQIHKSFVFSLVQNVPECNALCALSTKSDSHLVRHQSLAHSFLKQPGVYPSPLHTTRAASTLLEHPHVPLPSLLPLPPLSPLLSSRLVSQEAE